jgi:Ser/Thr protein kinase RdoA (MazF antagonist)
VERAPVATRGEVLASFHLSAAVVPAARAREKTEQMSDSVLGNVAQLVAHLEPTELQPSVGRLVDRTHDCARELGNDLPTA